MVSMTIPGLEGTGRTGAEGEDERYERGWWRRMVAAHIPIESQCFEGAGCYKARLILERWPLGSRGGSKGLQ